MHRFLTACQTALADSDQPAARTVLHLLRDAAPPNNRPAPGDHPDRPKACKHLEATLASAETTDLADSLAQVQGQLTWWAPAPGMLTSHMEDRNAAVEIVGPEAVWRSDALRLGVFLIAPDTTYPLHSHAAEEIYMPISGAGEWQIVPGPVIARAPGDLIHIAPWQAHAIRTGPAPLLMLWAWFGDISFDAYRTEPDALDIDGRPRFG